MNNTYVVDVMAFHHISGPTWLKARGVHLFELVHFVPKISKSRRLVYDDSPPQRLLSGNVPYWIVVHTFLWSQRSVRALGGWVSVVSLAPSFVGHNL